MMFYVFAIATVALMQSSMTDAFATLSTTPTATAFFAPRRLGQDHNRRSTSFASTSATQLGMVADNAKVILVTGSSRGLGKSIALDLGAHGQRVVVNYVSDGSKESAEATVKEIEQLGGEAMAVQADSTYALCLWRCITAFLAAECVEGNCTKSHS
jgi:short chain dehydrogenase